MKRNNLFIGPELVLTYMHCSSWSLRLFVFFAGPRWTPGQDHSNSVGTALRL